MWEQRTAVVLETAKLTSPARAGVWRLTVCPPLWSIFNHKATSFPGDISKRFAHFSRGGQRWPDIPAGRRV